MVIISSAVAVEHAEIAILVHHLLDMAQEKRSHPLTTVSGVGVHISDGEGEPISSGTAVAGRDQNWFSRRFAARNDLSGISFKVDHPELALGIRGELLL